MRTEIDVALVAFFFLAGWLAGRKAMKNTLWKLHSQGSYTLLDAILFLDPPK